MHNLLSFYSMKHSLYVHGFCNTFLELDTCFAFCYVMALIHILHGYFIWDYHWIALMAVEQSWDRLMNRYMRPLSSDDKVATVRSTMKACAYFGEYFVCTFKIHKYSLVLLIHLILVSGWTILKIERIKVDVNQSFNLQLFKDMEEHRS